MLCLVHNRFEMAHGNWQYKRSMSIINEKNQTIKKMKIKMGGSYIYTYAEPVGIKACGASVCDTTDWPSATRKPQ